MSATQALPSISSSSSSSPSSSSAATTAAWPSPSSPSSSSPLSRSLLLSIVIFLFFINMLLILSNTLIHRQYFQTVHSTHLFQERIEPSTSLLSPANSTATPIKNTNATDTDDHDNDREVPITSSISTIAPISAVSDPSSPPPPPPPPSSQRAQLTWQVCTMVRDVGYLLPEWIEFHLMMGMTHLYIYDHESSDDSIKRVVETFQKGYQDHSDKLPFLYIEYLRWPPNATVEKQLNKQRITRGVWLHRSEEQYKGTWEGDRQFDGEDTITDLRSACIRSEEERRAGAPYKDSVPCQKYAFQDCYARSLGRRDIISNHDVDEYFWVWRDENTANTPLSVTEFVQSEYGEALRRGRYLHFPAVNFGAYEFGDEVPMGSLLTKVLQKRAPYGHLGEDDKGIAARADSGCNVVLSDGFRLCDGSGGKSIYPGHMIVAPKHVGIHVAEQVNYDFVYMTSHSPALRLHHYQQRSLNEAKRAAALQMKPHTLQTVLHAKNYFNSIQDNSLNCVIHELEERMKLRQIYNLTWLYDYKVKIA